MKNCVVFVIFCLIFWSNFLTLGQDTISIEIGEKAKIWMYAPDRESFKKLGQININRIVRDIIRASDTLKGDKNISFEFEYKPQVWWGVEEYSTDTLPSKTTYRRSSSFWNIDIGLNNYLENGKTPVGSGYALSNLGSRYFAIGMFQRLRLGKKHSPFSVQAGLEVSWYNFMFERSNYITYNDNRQVEFRDYISDFGQSLSRNKLTIPYLNIPIMVNMRLYGIGNKALTFGIGGYVGYRLNSYAMVQPERKRLRTFDSFNLNTWRYGLETQLGYGGILLFARYDLNSLFINKADSFMPQLNAFTFGIRL
ncbi:MAG: PorT family protein [Microscillaceae bacterium]|nr:PorT family protein [Microscillaceae bacterium]MDW8459692.1 outer membrane beta-barrel protein [Cytophagales bacterium]